MPCKRLSILLLFLAIASISSAVEVNRSVQKNENVLASDALNEKKLLPDIKHLLKENSDGNRQRFLHLIRSLENDGYKFVNGR
jgi:hypothetical protein